MPGLKFKELKMGKDEIYLDRRSGREADFRMNIIKEYSEVEKNIESFKEKKISGRDFANALGRIEMGLKEEHPSAQIYAFEQLLKSLSETENQEDINEIVNEIIYDISFEMNRIKSEYLLGIAAFYTGKYQMEEVEKKSQTEKRGDVWPEERIKILKNFYSALGKDNKDLADYMKNIHGVDGVVDFIKADYPEKTSWGQVARLVAKYYEMNMREVHLNDEEREEVDQEVRQRVSKGENKDAARWDIMERMRMIKKFPTAYPLLPKEDVDVSSVTTKKRPSTGIPELIVKLPYGQHISGEKIEEADEHGIPLSVEIVRDTLKNGKTKRVRVRFSQPNVIIDGYVRLVRDYKEKKDITKEQVNRAYAAARNEIWNKLDTAAKEALGGNIGLTELHCNSIRDEKNRDVNATYDNTDWPQEAFKGVRPKTYM